MGGLVYVCHPYTYDPAYAKERVQKICRQLLHDGNVPIAPQLFLGSVFPDLDADPKAADLLLAECYKYIALCDRMFWFGGRSYGCDKEFAFAVALKKPVELFCGDCFFRLPNRWPVSHDNPQLEAHRTHGWPDGEEFVCGRCIRLSKKKV